jgi:membrane-bound metal-dependent hydrolase YbcI (DUF457 family)
MGRTHVLTGLVGGALAWDAAPGVSTTRDGVLWVAACGGFSLLPDLDQRGTSAARMWGPITQAVARGVGWVARGHRVGTHDILLAPVVAGGVAALAAGHRWPSGVLVAVAVGLGLRGLVVLRVARRLRAWPLNVGLSAGVGWWATGQGQGLPWLPWAVAAGVVAHILGDALTTGRVPVPLLWMRGTKPRWGLPLGDTGTWVEPALSGVSLVWLVVIVGQHHGIDVTDTILRIRG